MVDDVKDELGVGGVQPVDDAVVVHRPLRRTEGLGRWRIEDVCEAEFPDHGSEEGAPLAIVGLVEVEQHRNVGTDVHHLW